MNYYRQWRNLSVYELIHPIAYSLILSDYKPNIILLNTIKLVVNVNALNVDKWNHHEGFS